VQQHGRVLADRIHQDRPFEIGRDLSHYADAFRLEALQVDV